MAYIYVPLFLFRFDLYIAILHHSVIFKLRGYYICVLNYWSYFDVIYDYLNLLCLKAIPVIRVPFLVTTRVVSWQ